MVFVELKHITKYNKLVVCSLNLPQDNRNSEKSYDRLFIKENKSRNCRQKGHIKQKTLPYKKIRIKSSY